MISRIKPLDGLRALSAFGVIWIHTWGFYASPVLPFFSFNLYQLVAIVGNGVDFFFVISGFCMYLVWGNKMFDWRRYFQFLKKRFLRIAPAFYMSVLVYALIIKFSNNNFSFWYNTFFHVLFLNNVVTGNTISGPFWSIGTEWHFYIILPFLLYLSTSFFLPKTLVFFSSLSILLFCVVNTGYLSYDWWESQILIRFPEFAVGIAAAWFYLQGKKLPRSLSGKWGLMAGLLIMYTGRCMKFTPVLESAGNAAVILKSLADTVMTAGFGLLLFHVITQPSFFANWLSGKLINYFGRISYSIYLWHSLAFIILTPTLKALPFENLNVLPGFILVSLLTILISHFSYKYLEAFYFTRKVPGSSLKTESQSKKISLAPNEG